MTTHTSKSKNVISYNSVQMNNFMTTQTSNSIILFPTFITTESRYIENQFYVWYFQWWRFLRAYWASLCAHIIIRSRWDSNSGLPGCYENTWLVCKQLTAHLVMYLSKYKHNLLGIFQQWRGLKLLDARFFPNSLQSWLRQWQRMQRWRRRHWWQRRR